MIVLAVMMIFYEPYHS